MEKSLKPFGFLIVFTLFYSSFAFSQLSKSSPFLERKNFLDVAQKTSINRGLALVHSECLKNKTKLPSWLQSATSFHIPNQMKALALSFSLENLTQKQLDLESENPCLLALSEDGWVQSASLNDPEYKNQLFFEFSHFENYHSTFQSPLFESLPPTTVAVIDSGISLSHPEFLGKFWTDGQGHVGYNFIHDSYNVEDDYGHGTHVAGLIAATSNNGIGVVGVSQNVRLMILKTQDSQGSGTIGSMVNAIRYATDQGAEVINLSLAVGVNDPMIQDAVDYALERGVVLIVSAGNNGIEITSQQFISPAGLAGSRPGLISVGSTDSSNGELSYFSNYSTQLVEIAAPGSHGVKHILSTYKNERYFALAGTSMSAPQVAGLAAQLISYFKSANISYDPESIENFIFKTSRSNSHLNSYIQQGREIDFQKFSEMILKNFELSSDGGFND